MLELIQSLLLTAGETIGFGDDLLAFGTNPLNFGFFKLSGTDSTLATLLRSILLKGVFIFFYFSNIFIIISSVYCMANSLFSTCLSLSLMCWYCVAKSLSWSNKLWSCPDSIFFTNSFISFCLLTSEHGVSFSLTP
jgi:hypothetical protein